MLYHAGIAFPAGFIGVDVFFVLSGFVITAMLKRQVADFGRVKIVDFYRRRVRRLLPAAALMVTVTVGAAILLQNPGGDQQTTAKTALGATVLAANLVLARTSGGYFTSTAETNPLLHTWSLAVEEQFYLLFPIAISVVVGVSLARRRRSVLVAGSATALSFFLAMSVEAGTATIPFFGAGGADSVFYSPFTRAWEFGAGVIAAVCVAPGWILGRLAQAIRVTGYLLIAGNALLVVSSPFSVVLVIPAVTGAALICWVQPVGVPLRRTWQRLGIGLQWIGDRSYSWYLWHWPIIVMTALLFSSDPVVLGIAAAASLIPAMLSFRWVETPFRRRPSTHRFGTTVLAATCIAVPGAAALGLGFGASIGWGQEWALGSHQVMRNGCDTGQIATQRCSWNTQDSEGTVMLIGDSQAWSIGDSVIAAAAEFKYGTLTAVRNGCSLSRRNELSSTCADHNEELHNAVQRIKPEIVVIAQNSLGYVSEPGKISAWIEDLEAAVNDLLEHTEAVLIVGVIPQGDGRAAEASLLIKPARPRGMPLSSQPPLRNELIRLEDLLARNMPRVSFLDPADALCNRNVCQIAIEASELYVDGNHLSPAGAQVLTDHMRTKLMSLLP